MLMHNPVFALLVGMTCVGPLGCDQAAEVAAGVEPSTEQTDADRQPSRPQLRPFGQLVTRVQAERGDAVDAILEEGRLALSRRDYDAALHQANAAIDVWSTHEEALSFKDQVLQQRRISMLIGDAWSSIDRGDHEAATRRARELLELEPGHGEAARLLNVAATIAARARYERTLERLDPDGLIRSHNAEAWATLSDVVKEANALELATPTAATQYDRASALIAPAVRDARIKRAGSLLESNDVAGAYTLLLHVVRNDPEDTAAAESLTQLLSKGPDVWLTLALHRVKGLEGIDAAYTLMAIAKAQDAQGDATSAHASLESCATALSSARPSGPRIQAYHDLITVAYRLGVPRQELSSLMDAAHNAALSSESRKYHLSRLAGLALRVGLLEQYQWYVRGGFDLHRPLMFCAAGAPRTAYRYSTDEIDRGRVLRTAALVGDTALFKHVRTATPIRARGEYAAGLVAYADALIGDRQAALASIRRVRDTADRQWPTEALIDSLAAAGDLDEARRLIDTLSDPKPRAFAAGKVAAAELASGRADPADIAVEIESARSPYRGALEFANIATSLAGGRVRTALPPNRRVNFFGVWDVGGHVAQFGLPVKYALEKSPASEVFGPQRVNGRYIQAFAGSAPTSGGDLLALVAAEAPGTEVEIQVYDNRLKRTASKRVQLASLEFVPEAAAP